MGKGAKYDLDSAENGEFKESKTDISTSKSETELIATAESRDAWGNKVEFILASISLAVGLGSIWRFPYLCQKNGGGAFLIPYFVMMIIEGFPLFFIEFAIGQRFRRGAIGCWSKIHPALLGIGISSLIISFLLCIYYIVVIGWSFYYMFVSFTKTLPWRKEDCPDYGAFKNLTDICKQQNSTSKACNETRNFPQCCIHDPQLYYFFIKFLDVSPGIEDLGDGIQWKNLGCLALSWVIVFICIAKGVKSSGKAVYFTATFPYVILLVLFIVGVRLKGATNGLKALFYPDFKRLLDPEIWMDAATQMFFNLSLGFGALVSFASYNPIRSNCIKDAYIVVLVNFFTAIFSAMVVFCILGYREAHLGKSADTIGSGPGLAFITFCDVFLELPFPQAWAAFFFFMLILLGIGSEFGTLEGAIAPFYDMKWVSIRKEIFTGIVILVLLGCGLGLVSSSGYYAFQLFDDYCVSLGLLFITFFQTVAVSWVYGNDRFADDLEFMTGSRPNIFWMVCWKYISPLAILVIFFTNFYKLATTTATYKAYVGCPQQLTDYSPHSKGVEGSLADIEYPWWGKIFIFIMIFSTMAPILISIAVGFYKNPKQMMQGISKKLRNIYEYHPDPRRVDVTRQKTKSKIQMEILADIETDNI
ncbi:sodium-dependent neutral amino acid transporter B(0)AT3-like isoform X2 [Hydra vulgaris]|uniref:Transporter n=1 Tax=Hydra vulgaris TaxID=6087 RepID=A0ABM4DN20_HYDVU